MVFNFLLCLFCVVIFLMRRLPTQRQFTGLSLCIMSLSAVISEEPSCDLKKVATHLHEISLPPRFYLIIRTTASTGLIHLTWLRQKDDLHTIKTTKKKYSAPHPPPSSSSLAPLIPFPIHHCRPWYNPPSFPSIVPPSQPIL